MPKFPTLFLIIPSDGMKLEKLSGRYRQSDIKATLFYSRIEQMFHRCIFHSGSWLSSKRTATRCGDFKYFPKSVSKYIGSITTHAWIAYVSFFGNDAGSYEQDNYPGVFPGALSKTLRTFSAGSFIEFISSQHKDRDVLLPFPRFRNRNPLANKENICEDRTSFI